MARHANSPSGPGNPRAVETSDIKEEEGLVELSSEEDTIGGTEGAGAQRREGGSNEDGAASVKGE
ncbi:hypothetical protein [Caballeronia sp. GAWG1-5s-s]|uniref:hypothetical protein n=1 Tax=Caballeronia sp. GAWG1-5s-s TaxID=2921743 RepID=UPI0020283A08|nr:hypothetical protein [Caballeronia sp. GAWG1-5s-s]